MFSTDDYFLQNGVYHYSQENLSEAHAWNKKRGERGIHVCVCNNNNFFIQFFERLFGPYHYQILMVPCISTL